MKSIRVIPLTLFTIWLVIFCCYYAKSVLKTDEVAGSKRMAPPRNDVISSRGSRPIKYNNRTDDTKINNESRTLNNILHVRVDTSKFQKIDLQSCKSTLLDIEVAPAYSMPLTALASFPRSGNTWSRSLIQIATKYSTGSAHWEAERKIDLKNWFKAGSEDFKLRKGVCVKTHFYGENHIPNFDNGAILLLRNPYYSLVSEFMRFYSRLRNVSMPEIIRSMRNRDERWTKFLPTYAEKWRDTAINWITLCERLMIVFYEDLEENPIHELSRMVKFLGQPVLPRRIQCAVHFYAPMKGRQDHASQMTFDPYTPEMHGIVDGYITEVNRTLLQKNANPLPVYEKYLLSS